MYCAYNIIICTVHAVVLARYGTEHLLYTAAVNSKEKTGSWSRLDFLLEHGCVLQHAAIALSTLSYRNDSRISYFPVTTSLPF